MDVTVILCTYNRCQSLAKALESVAHSEMPESGSWEVLVVDNNSKDATRNVVAEAAERYPGRFRYLFEPQQGKSYALNAGIRESHGKVLAFMDDDVVVDSHWLQKLTAIFEQAGWEGAGGRILPEGSFVPPRWLSVDGKYALAPLALFDLGLEPGELREPPIGTNMAFRKEVFEKLGGFRTDLGPSPGSEARSEDMEFGDRVLGAGQRLWYEPSAVVYHSLPANRLTREYFLAWWHDKAQADLRASGLPQDGKLRLAGVPIHLFRRLARWTLEWLTAMSEPRRFSSKLNVWMVLGEISECRRISSAAGQQGQL